MSIGYSVRDTDGDTGTNTPNAISPTFEYSTNGGSSWTAIASTTLATGDAYNKTTQKSAYTAYEATWNAESSIADVYSATAQIRVTANDNEGANNTAATTTANFTLDTAEPTLGTPTGGGTGINVNQNATTSLGTDKVGTTSVTLQLSSSDDQALQMKISNTTDCSSGTYESYASTRAWPLASSDASKTVSAQFRDPAGNVSTCATDTITLDTTAPAVPANMQIQDISNATEGVYRLFVNWGVITDSGDFVDYRVYRSTDSGSTYTLVSTIANIATNSYTDTSVSSGTTYTYLVNSRDDLVNISASSTAVSLAPGSNPVDRVAPTVSSAASSTITSSSAHITWTTSENSSSFVEFGKTTSYGQTAGQYDSVTSHSVSLPKTLDAATQYNFRIRSIDPSGNEATSANYTFTTSASPSDTTAPTISGISTREPTQTSVTITWATNEDADSYINYSKDLSYIKEQGSPAMTQDHSVTLVGLDINSEYFFRVKSTDPSGNIATDNNSDSGHSFVTATSTTAAPTISNIQITDIGANAATIRWTTNKAASSTVEYGFDTSYGFSSGFFTASTTHTVPLPSNLLSDAVHHFRVRSVDSDNNEAVSADSTFTTATPVVTIVGSTRFLQSDTSSPVPILVKAQNITDTTAEIIWTTTEYASSEVRYGETQSYGLTVGDLADPSATKNHSVLLEDLSSDTEYNYEALTQDSSGNIGRSGNFKLTTLPASTLEITEDEEVTPPAEEEIDVSDAEPTEPEEVKELNDAILEKVESVAKVAREEIEKIEKEVGTDKEKEDVFAEAIKKISEKRPESLRRRIAQETIDDLSESSARTIFAESFSRLTESLSFEQLSASLEQAAKNIVFPPQVLGDYPQVREITANSAIIIWITNKPSNSMVAVSSAEEYDPNKEEPYTVQLGDAEERVASHIVQLTNLEPDTTYHYQVLSRADVGGVGKSQDKMFTTQSELPRITGLVIAEITEHTAILKWSTNISTDTTIEYTNLQTGETFTQGEPTLLRSHSFTLENLEFNNTYRVRIRARDEFGNEARTSYITFSTSTDDAPPQISQVRSETAISPQGSKVQAIITWKTNEPATTQIFYQEGLAAGGEAQLFKTSKDTSPVLNHIVVVTNFKPASVYKFYVESEDLAGNKARSKDFTILTPRRQQTVVQVILKNFGETFGFLQRLKL